MAATTDLVVEPNTFGDSPTNVVDRIEALEAQNAAYADKIAQHSISARRKQTASCRPSFGLVAWVLFTTLTALWIIDRFTWQINPRQTYSIGAGVVAGDPTDIKVGPLSVAFYDVFARISGRLLTL